MAHYDLLLRGGTLVSHRGEALGDVAVRDGSIERVGDLASDTADEVIDVTGLHVLPGVIDTQVHFREPGGEHKEDLESGSRGAVLGGVTGVFEMPNTKPSTTTRAALLDKLERARGRMWCDHAFYVGANGSNAADLAEAEVLDGCCGVKLFMGSSTGDLLVEDDEGLRTALAGIRRRCAVHAEDEPRLRERMHIAEEGAHPRVHATWRDEETALRATQRLIRVARQLKQRVHVLHVSTAQEMDFLRGCRDIATVETTPHHLTMTAPECYERLGTKAQMNPPVRTADHRDALWQAITDGIVDVLGSDHAPHTLDEKAKPYPTSPSGMTGVQTLVPMMLNHVHEGRLTLPHLVDLVCASPARIFGIERKGRIAAGFDADFTVVDVQSKRTIEDDWIASRAGWTPYHGVTVTGWPIHTILRGACVVRDGALEGEARGEPLHFQEVTALKEH